MAIELKVPSAGESITEVTIVEWVKEVGSSVSSDETLALIETDKANVELPAPVAGTLTKILKDAGEMAEVGEVIGYIEEGGGDTPAPKKGKKKKAKDDERPKEEDDSAWHSPDNREDVTDEESDAEAPEAAPPPAYDDEDDAVQTALPGRAEEKKKSKKAKSKKAKSPEVAPAPAERPRGHADPALHLSPPKASPSLRRKMLEEQIDPSSVQGSGPDGRIWPGDLDPRMQAEPTGGSRATERVKMTRLRSRIAERLVQAQTDAALLTTFNEVDMTDVMALRKNYQDRFVKRHDVKLGFMSFFVKAAVEALKELPALNARIEGDEVVYHDYQDIGVAVGGGKGLVVPVIRNAERLSFAQVEKTIGDFAVRAKNNRLKVEELQNGTFTLSNGGIYGSLLSTPIVNPPQSGILGMHAIQDRPVAKDGQVVIRKMMYLALTYDHRLVDGREAVTFLVRIKELIEDPTRLLLEV